jgi:sorbitol/mannitol transport system permease protein
MSTIAVPSRSKRRPRRIPWDRSAQMIAIIAATVLMFGPILWLIVTSFKTEIDAYTLPPKVVFSPTLANYRDALQSFWAPLLHSVVVVGVSTAFSLVLGILAAFALSYYVHPNNQNVVFWFLSTKAMPAVAVLIPLFVVFRTLHLLDTPWALIILYTAMNMPIVVWMMHAFISELPSAVLEAAQVDGVNLWQLLWHIVVPLTRAGIASTAMLCIIFGWNEFLFAVSYTATRWMTLPVAVASQQSSHGLFWAKLSAFTTLAIIVPVVVGWLTQKQLVRGLTAGGVK